jgi:mono/diheme cytochrome c family protein
MRLWNSVAVSLCLLFSSHLFAASKDQRHRGAELFAATGCRHCHTIQNQGGHKGPDLSGVGRILTKTQIREQILHGGKQMPPFTDYLEPSEVNDLVTYLRSCREKTKTSQPISRLALDKGISH